MRYCSFETRKVLDSISDYGIEIPESDYIHIEQCVGRFWNTRMIKVVEKVVNPKNIERAAEGGWPWFEKPILSMLSGQGCAARTNPVEFEITDHVRMIYNLCTSSLLLADFNMAELALLTGEIPAMVSDVHQLALAIDACKRTGSRSVYYLNGVIRREYQTRQGKIREIQQQSAESGQGWTIPDTYEKMDITERRELDADWLDKLNSITIAKALNVVD